MRDIYHEPPTKRLDMFEDRELLGELFRRGRLRSVEARHTVAPFVWGRYSQEAGFIDRVRKQLSLMTADNLMRNDQFHFEIPARTSLYGSPVEVKSDLWIITQPKHRRREDGEIR